MGYKGVESTELVYSGYRCSDERVLGGADGVGKGFGQMMDALEVGRVNVAARGVGIAQRALELALKYSQERKTFGKPIAQHQAIQFKLADMATKIEAARLVTRKAARMKDAGERSDLEAGMAKLIASETGKEMRRGRLPDPRRLRLLQGVRDRAPLPRRAAAADRRGHLRDPAHGHRQEAARAQQGLSTPRVALVSGASRGIGAEIARQLAAEHRLLVFAGGRDPADVETGERVAAIQLDVTDQASVDSAIERVRADGGRLDVLVNNAGIGGSYSDTAAELDLEQARETLETNLFGAWRLTKAALPLLRDSEDGRIVNVSSGAGQLDDMQGGYPAYRISKSGAQRADQDPGGRGARRSHQRPLPGLGPHRHGRQRRLPLGGGGRRHRGLAGDGPGRRQRRFLQGPQADPLVAAQGATSSSPLLPLLLDALALLQLLTLLALLRHWWRS